MLGRRDDSILPTGPDPRYPSEGMNGAVSIIADEHRSISAVIDAMQHLARDIEAGGEPDYEVLTVILDYIDAFPNFLHHPKEDRYLFSALRLRIAEWTDFSASAAATQVLDELEAEHNQGNELTRELRFLLTRCRISGQEARQALVAAVDRYARFHRAHMRKEEDVVLPLALSSLTADDWAVIERAFRATDPPGPGALPQQELGALFRLIVALTARPKAPGTDS